MPLTLTDTPTLPPFSPIVVPADGDARTAESVQSPFQQLANRTAGLASMLSVFGTGLANGVTQIQRAANVAALRAITAANRSDGNNCYVDYFGLYEFLAADTMADDGALTIQPSDISSGAGRWVSAVRTFQSTPTNLVVSFGFVGTDTTGRAPASMVRNGIVAMDQHQGTGPFTNPGSTYVNISTPATCSLPGLIANDVIYYELSWMVNNLASGDVTNFEAAIVDGSGGSHFSNQLISLPSAVFVSGASIRYCIGDFYVVSSGSQGTHTVTPRWNVTAATSGSSVSNLSCRAFAVRP